MPVLLAFMTRVLPGVLVGFKDANLAEERVLRRVIENADAQLLEQMETMQQVPAPKRLLYWRALLAAMIEDRVITPVKPPRRKPAA